MTTLTDAALDSGLRADPDFNLAGTLDDGSLHHVVRLSKKAGRTLADDKLRTQIDSIVASVNTGQRQQRGWKIEVAPWHRFARANPSEGSLCRDCRCARDSHAENWYKREYQYTSASTGLYLYSVDVNVDCAPQRKRNTFEVEFQNIVASMASRGRAFSGENWTISAVDGKSYVAKAPEDMAPNDAAEIGYAPFAMPLDWKGYFTDLYGLDDQIELIIDAIVAAQRSNWQGRYNVALIGPPGCGKTNICQLLRKMLGDEAVLEFDGTSTTMAGAQKELSEREELPRILFVEEIEKAPESSLAWLLSIGDSRAEIRKTTARGNLMRDVKMLVVCTVNDLATFERVNFGALGSRFPNKIGFNRPSREIRRRILQREIDRVPGSSADWIEPAIKFAEEIGSDDPRDLISICMCGREKLLTGEYQRMRRAVRVSEPTKRAATSEYAF